MDDIILVTVDCWRHDAPQHMTKFQSLTDDWADSNAITASSATNGVFPPLFASCYYPEAYDEAGIVADDVVPLPQVLSDAGYQTAGFVASNPFLGKWSQYFDSFWNDGIREESGSIGGGGEYATYREKISKFLKLQEKVSAQKLFDMADEWWQQTSSPRFLWLHLMGPHQPYKPGLRLGWEHGLLRAYASIIASTKFEPHIYNRDRVLQSLKRLHFQSVASLDADLVPWLEQYADSATIVVTGDHGEEFDHGFLGHARLYDETVRVPIYTNRDDLLPVTKGVRQVDLAPSLVNYVDVSKPDGWEGQVWGETMPVQPMIAGSPKLKRIYTGTRSADWKLIHTYDWDGNMIDSMGFDLTVDPDEREPLPPSEAPETVVSTLDAFESRRSIRQELRQSSATEFGDEVSARLRDLGYVE